MLLMGSKKCKRAEKIKGKHSGQRRRPGGLHLISIAITKLLELVTLKRKEVYLAGGPRARHWLNKALCCVIAWQGSEKEKQVCVWREEAKAN